MSSFVPRVWRFTVLPDARFALRLDRRDGLTGCLLVCVGCHSYFVSCSICKSMTSAGTGLSGQQQSLGLDSSSQSTAASSSLFASNSSTLHRILLQCLPQQSILHLTTPLSLHLIIIPTIRRVICIDGHRSQAACLFLQINALLFLRPITLVSLNSKLCNRAQHGVTWVLHYLIRLQYNRISRFLSRASFAPLLPRQSHTHFRNLTRGYQALPCLLVPSSPRFAWISCPTPSPRLSQCWPQNYRTS